jgi:hypothetical protein
MRTVTILRPDITGGEVADVLGRALGPNWEVIVIPATGTGNEDAVLVKTGSSRLWRVHVSVVRQLDRTKLSVTPGGLLFGRLVNSFGIARTVTRVLHQSAELRMPA